MNCPDHKIALKADLASLFGKDWDDDQVLLEQLADEINYLIRADFNKLIFILYKIDVSEEKVQGMLSEKNSNAGKGIALLLIERQLEKIEKRSRENTSIDIPDDEKW